MARAAPSWVARPRLAPDQDRRVNIGGGLVDTDHQVGLSPCLNRNHTAVSPGGRQVHGGVQLPRPLGVMSAVNRMDRISR